MQKVSNWVKRVYCAVAVLLILCFLGAIATPLVQFAGFILAWLSNSISLLFPFLAPFGFSIVK